MEDTEKEILKSVKTLLHINDDASDEILLLIIRDVTDALLSYCRIEVLPRQLVSFIPSLVQRRYEKEKNSGVKSITEGDRRVEYGDENYDFLSEYAARLKPFVSRSVMVPSDMDMEVSADDKSV